MADGLVAVAGMVSGSILLLVGAQLNSAFAVGSTLAIAFGLVSSTDGSFWSATIEAGGVDVGAACGLLNTGSNIGGFVAPVLTPMIAAVAGWSAALYFACFVVAIASAIWFLMKPRMEPKTSALRL